MCPKALSDPRRSIRSDKGLRGSLQHAPHIDILYGWGRGSAPRFTSARIARGLQKATTKSAPISTTPRALARARCRQSKRESEREREAGTAPQSRHGVCVVLQGHPGVRKQAEPGGVDQRGGRRGRVETRARRELRHELVARASTLARAAVGAEDVARVASRALSPQRAETRRVAQQRLRSNHSTAILQFRSLRRNEGCFSLKSDSDHGEFKRWSTSPWLSRTLSKSPMPDTVSHQS